MISKLKYLILIIGFVFLSKSIIAQTSETIIVQGNVLLDSGNVVSNAKVKIVDLDSSEPLDSSVTDSEGNFFIEFTKLTGVKEEQEIPRSFELSQNYPNPFAKNTSINFFTKKEGDIKLEVFNVLGQKIITLYDDFVSPSNIKVNWDGRNYNNKKVAPGMYIYRLTFNNQVVSKKMIYNIGAKIISNYGTGLYKSSNNNITLSKSYSTNNLELSISHPSMVTIVDTFETNTIDSIYTFNYLATTNNKPVADLQTGQLDAYTFNFDASNSTDDFSPLANLRFQCDVNGDSISDIPGGDYSWQVSPYFMNSFATEGNWNIGVRVKDGDGAVSDWIYKTAYGNSSGVPSDVLPFYDLWKITLGSGSTVSSLVGYESADYFYNVDEDTTGWVVYKTPNSGGTTPNSSNTRSELRQLEEWTPETGGNLKATLKVMHVSTSGDAHVPATFSVVVGQIHSSEGHENEPLKIFYKKFPGHKKGSLFWNYEINTEGSNSERWDFSTPVWGYDWSVVGETENTYPNEPVDGIELGEEFSYEVNVYEGIMYLTFSSEGHETKTFTKNLISSEYTNYADIPQQVLTVFSSTGQDGTEMVNAYSGELQYFKQGAYNQTNGKDPASNMIWNTGSNTYGGNLSEQYAKGSYAEVWFKSASVGPGMAP